ncbi:MAG: hypothetical protein IJU27_07195 [Bacteroidales bacterium]|nr:hypothetical protein [Bacteroidales bacterium]
MKKAAIIVIAVLCLGAMQLGTQQANAQQPSAQQAGAKHFDPKAAEYLKENLPRTGNNIHSYETVPDVESPAPAGFKAFYISHYGRHGSRSTSGQAQFQELVDILTSAKNVQILTPQGDSLLNEAALVLKYHDTMDGRLTQRGVREHREIAARLYDRHPEVLGGAKKIRAIASTSQRCIVSMNSFTVSLGQKNPDLFFYLDSGSKMMSYISNTGDANRLTFGTEQMIAEWTKDWPVDTVSIMKTLFTSEKAARILVPSSSHLQDLIFHAAQVAEDFDIPTTPYRFLPFDAIYKRWSENNHYLYMHHGNSAEFGDQRVPLAESLVQDIIDKAEEAIAGGEWAADLRFGHDYPILALVSYLGLDGVSKRLSFDQVDSEWYGWENLCMGSNLQMIFYRNDAGVVLVKFLYNEHEKTVQGLKPYQGCYYRWDDIKADPAGYRRY